MSVRYIGSKARIVDQIMDIVGQPGDDGTFVDAFCGTGAVAEAAARAGWSVRINDHLRCAVTIAGARLLHREHVPFEAFGGYQQALERLNAAAGPGGFVWREYSPASSTHAAVTGVERKYFTEHNAARIDAMRGLIAEWAAQGDLTPSEETLLIGDLLIAANAVANIAGTYGCFLRGFSPNALRAIEVCPRDLFEQHVRVESTHVDVYDVSASPGDVIYFDPPYTKRQYAAYYHLLETIAIGDEPDVEGITGLRPWKTKASPFCYKTRALAALARLIDETAAQRILLSYSSEAHASLDELLDAVSASGVATMHYLGEISRYRPNQAARHNAATVNEVVIEVIKADVTEPATGRPA